MIKGLSETTASKAQLGLGHSYSRAKVKFNVNRVDNMIIQSICLLDQLDKDINIFSMRMRFDSVNPSVRCSNIFLYCPSLCREWYSYHFPELMKIINDNHMYARLAKVIGNRKTLNDEKAAEIEEITMDAAKAQEIITASKSSMGICSLDYF
jgi:RNA processing factor Prp31